MKKKIREQAKGKDDSSSRELSTIVEDKVSGVDNQLGGFLREIKEDFRTNHELVLLKLRENTYEAPVAAQKAATSLAERKLPASDTRPLKRKLDFVDLTDDDTTILNLIRQRSIGSPFAFYLHKGLVMLGEETPKFLDLLFRPLEGIRFDGDDLAVAVFIFASEWKKVRGLLRIAIVMEVERGYSPYYQAPNSLMMLSTWWSGCALPR
ncbi:hypothetical protein PIB30_033921 [Stylosanthes scabra]|uniref:Uncharacterized protein n=1 Tax=Stylosanthes scabra TaxID=79078 RepID=A0ABU6XA77_9FABA|nr:hypothetical protein [Stylosanthes scabra]